MILCLGTTPVYQRSMVFDRLTIDRVNRAKSVADYASGKSVNAARVIHTMGGDVLATGFVGGARGDALLADLTQSGMEHDFVKVSPETRQCITLIDQSSEHATEIVEESSPVGPAAWESLWTKLSQRLSDAQIWVFSGTLAPDASKDFYARWLPMAAKQSARAIVDVVGEPLRLAMRHSNAILKMNREELGLTIGKDLSADESLIKAVCENTPASGALVVTMGADGAIASEGGRCWRAKSPKIQAVSAVGSGDAFAGGLALAMSRGQSMADALHLAVACGSANAMTDRAGHLHPADVESLIKQIRIEIL
jgi:tagatose 6-phosphate kinase